MYVLHCSQCNRRFQDEDKGEALTRLRKHQLKDHKDWLQRRIKSGMKKSKKASESLPNWPNWIGFAERPLIEKITGKPYEEVRSAVLDFFVSMLLGGVTKP